jgi:hypothetical protein
MKLDNEKWNQVVVTDPLNLSGSSTREFLSRLIEVSCSRWVCVRDLEGAYSGLQGVGEASLSTTEFLNRVSHAVQYDWGFFFLYRKEPSISTLGSDDRKNISTANVAVKLVDDQYFYVYTRNDDVYDYLVKRYPDAEYKAATLQNIDIPN